MHRLSRRLLHSPSLWPLIAVGIIIGFSSLSYTLSSSKSASNAKPSGLRTNLNHHAGKAKALKPVVKTTPATKPTPPPSSVSAAPAPIPKPKIATDVTKSPAAVASSNTSPGTGVSSLTPTNNSPVPTTPTGTAGSSQTPAPTCTNTPGNYYSTNWSGYFRSGCNFTAISGGWTVPTPTTTSTTSVTTDSAWIGIGGVSSSDLIQVGTEETVATDGTINVAVFYELLPDMPDYPTSITVMPGDHMSASLVETSLNQWQISINDATSGQEFTKAVAYTSSHSSAEWIEEDPSYTDGTLVPFDNFGSISFSGSSSVGNTVTSNLADASNITLVNRRGVPLATPGAITGSSNDSFTVVRNNV